jgi:hypothetical protein
MTTGFFTVQVGIVYSAHNIWANVQETGHPWDMVWDLSEAVCWRPFFGPVLPHRELASLQVMWGTCRICWEWGLK